MRCSDNKLHTPIYLKLNESMAWPREEKVFYLLSCDGIFLGRNHPFFRSCVPVTSCPAELGPQRPFLELNYPKLPAHLVERIIGFFDLVAKRHSSEAVALLVWNHQARAVEAIVPDQIATVGTSWWGTKYPVDVSYEIPPLPAHLMLIGDIHSHCNYPAFSSYTDKADERYRPGLHIVAGRIWDEPPELHCEVLADGMRFRVQDLSLLMEGYHRRRTDEVPPEWISKVTIKPWSNKRWTDTAKNNDSPGGGGHLASSPNANRCTIPARHQYNEIKALAPTGSTDVVHVASPHNASAPEPQRSGVAAPSAKPSDESSIASVPHSSPPSDPLATP